MKAATILEPIDAQYPDHPGVTHYLIHSYDFVPIAKRGVAAANKYDKIAPSAPHALHMPSHIYSMVGMWEASIESNLRSAAVMKDYAAKNHPDAAFTALTHDFDFMQVAYLQLGQDSKARALMEETGTIKKINGPPRLGSYNGLATVPARYYLERQDWRGAAQLQPRGTPFPYADAITHFARAMGAAHLGELAAAQAGIDKLKELRATLERAKDSYWAEQIEIQILAAQGWVAQGQGRGEEALKFMRAAADVEDASEKTVSMENRLYPMRELLGDMLREQGAGAAALKEYEASMLATPNRLRGYYGAAKAAEMIGDTNKATDYFQGLVQLTRNSDGDRAEIREAKQALAKK